MPGFGHEEDGAEECDRQELAQRRDSWLHKRYLLRQDRYIDYEPDERSSGTYVIIGGLNL